MTDSDFREYGNDHVRTVIHRSYHPETHVPGWSGFVERDVTVFIGWHSNRLKAAMAARRVRRNM